MDRSWIHMDRLSGAYGMGVERFLDFAQNNPEFNGLMIRCPCQRCDNLTQLSIQQVRDHLYFNGFDLTYTRWIWHGEATSSGTSNVEPNSTRYGVHEDFDMMDKLRTDVEIDTVDNP